MIKAGPKGGRCIGFAAFMKSRDPALDDLLNAMRDDVKEMARDKGPFADRLRKIQHALVDMLAFLDPDFIRFPRASRTKV